MPGVEAEDAEEKLGWVKNSPDCAFSAGQCSAVVDERVWKAPFSWGPIFTGPTVKDCIHRDKILHVYSQHYFIIMIPTAQKNKTSMKRRDQLFFYKNKKTTSEQLKIPS